ncbi:hypothetical protein Nepgr_019733 [Nepenthes gracilis]|uniref:MADS-box domain-containing protein n=1 Tax=Nepenthes gracilis TaxID=150966 RepID=A0AAD3XUE2_NEPGR|nr:hypothetical protein Nepgr_019733 [Nepenthes gracilis]
MDICEEGLGHLKVEMVKMEKASNLQVTFSEHYTDLVKEARELCGFCGAKGCSHCLSPGEKAFSFTILLLNKVIAHFLVHNPSPTLALKRLLWSIEMLVLLSLTGNLLFLTIN